MRFLGTLTLAVVITLVGASACSSHASSGSSSSASSSSSANSGPSSTDSEGGTSAGEPISRDDAISEHWDEIKDYLNGSETVDACSTESGSCYSLDADIDNGEITDIYFNNGGDLKFSAEIDESGDASDADENGNSWNFSLDMNSSIVDNAVDDWAKAKGYDIQ